MDKRAANASLLSRKSELAARPIPKSNNRLGPYSGTWTYAQAAHLLRRGMFGPGYAQIRWAAEQGMAATIEKLFEELPMPAPPVNSSYADDPGVPIGETWINALYPNSNLGQEMGYRSRSLRSWTIGLVWTEGISIREKLTLFWQNHFPINSVLDSKFRYRYLSLLRSYAWGNFRELAKAVTIDPSMLIFLNGNQSRKGAPNENYARELLELFTIGKGPSAGPGDYTHFTEHDIMEIARALTGWKDFGFTTRSVDGTIGSAFISSRHDTGLKTLSHRFNFATIDNLGDQEYIRVIDIIFRQAEVARHICRKLYQWFIYYEIDEYVEAEVIEPMAQILIENDFEIKPALRALLSSEHFFDPGFYGVMIKNPLDFVMSILKPLGIKYSEPLDQKYNSWYVYTGYLKLMQMKFFDVPDVAGWKAYYLAPLYYRNWINASTLPVRMELIEKISTSGVFPFAGKGNIMSIDALDFVAAIDNPHNPDSVVEEFAEILLPKPLTDAQKNILKGILLPGLPDFEWTVEYSQYEKDPDNSNHANAIATRLKMLLNAMLNMPEFQLN